jgi:hypothetical protein
MDPVTTWLVTPRSGGTLKKEKSERLARLAIVFEWGVARLRSVVEEQFPAEARTLPTGALSPKRDLGITAEFLPWFKPIYDLDTYVMSARRFDLERASTADAIAAASAEVTPARLDRLGVVALRNALDVFTAKTDRSPETQLRSTLGRLSDALERALALRILEHGVDWIDALLDQLDRELPHPGTAFS